MLVALGPHAHPALFEDMLAEYKRHGESFFDDLAASIPPPLGPGGRPAYTRLIKIEVNGTRRLWADDAPPEGTPPDDAASGEAASGEAAAADVGASAVGERPPLHGSCTSTPRSKMGSAPCAGANFADTCFESGSSDYFNGCPPSVASLRCKFLLIATVDEGGLEWGNATQPAGSARAAGPSKAYWDQTLLYRRTAWYNIANTLALIGIILTM